ncbi:MAG: lysophospholipid acyltransferase family protein [candidate division KSB1 bacterium]|nr:lysophospholipid acyltransferase family protein [candidate division KSB1 bacterium]MDZ7341457.1 lysophospholipid acyltransferase family protein [candidate division KSB1 bacterium]
MTGYWRRTRKKIKNWLIFVLVRFGLRWLRSVSRQTAIKFMQTLGLIGFYLVPSERRKTIQHLTKVYGQTKSSQEIHRLAKSVFLLLGRNMADAFALSRFNAANVDRFVKWCGSEHLDAALKKGRGVIALTGHIGNWELMGAFIAMKGYVVNVVGAPIYDPRLDELVVQNRRSAGLKYIARGGATREIIRALQRNEIVGILIDQDTKHVDGVFVDFLGTPAYTPVGPVLLALKTGCAIVPMAIHSLKNGSHLVEIEPEIPLIITGNPERDRIDNTQACSAALERFIRKYPTQWVWMHERWKTRPPTANSR